MILKDIKAIYNNAINYNTNKAQFFFLARQPPVGQGLLIHEVSKITHQDPSQSVGLLWTSDQFFAEISTWKHNTHNIQTSMPSEGFEPTIPADERPQSYALDRVATGTGNKAQW